jgi:hypothetical protein
MSISERRFRIIGPTISCAGLFAYYARRARAKNARDEMGDDQGPPVLYMRPFGGELDLFAELALSRVILAPMLIGIVGSVALIGTAGKATDESITEASTEASESQQAEDDRNAPREVTPGKAFTIGSHSPGRLEGQGRVNLW